MSSANATPDTLVQKHQHLCNVIACNFTQHSQAVKQSRTNLSIARSSFSSSVLAFSCGYTRAPQQRREHQTATPTHRCTHLHVSVEQACGHSSTWTNLGVLDSIIDDRLVLVHHGGSLDQRRVGSSILRGELCNACDTDKEQNGTRKTRNVMGPEQECIQ